MNSLELDGSVHSPMSGLRVIQDVRMSARVELFNTHGPYCW
jgi:hypothetical protein